MRIAPLFLGAMLFGCQTGSTPPAPTKPGQPKPTGVSESGQMLSSKFPFVLVTTSSSFAHDYGRQIKINSVRVAGKECKSERALACVVEHWSGWTKEGGRSEAEALQSAADFFEAWDALFGWQRLVDTEVPAPLAAALSRPRAPQRVFEDHPTEPTIKYHPPRAEILQEDGVQVIAITRFIRGHVSQRGQHWSYEVSLFRRDNGEPYTAKPDGSLPRSRSYSEHGR